MQAGIHLKYFKLIFIKLLLGSSLLLCSTARGQVQTPLQVTAGSISFKSLPTDPSVGKSEGNRWVFIDSRKSEVHLVFNDTSGIYYSFSPNNGASWQTELLHPAVRKSRPYPAPLAAQNAAIRVDTRGTVHIFLVSAEFRYSPNKIWHYSRIRGGGKWRAVVIDENETGPLLGAAIDLDIDCNNHLHIVYTVGSAFTRYAHWNGNMWMFSDIAFGYRPAGCAVISGFENKIHVAIGSENGELGVATQTIGEKDWIYERIFRSAHWQCDLSLAPHGGLIVSSNDLLQEKILSGVKRPDSIWENFIYTPEDMSSAPIGHPTLRTDPSGRIHMNYLFTDSSGTGLSYMFSDDAGYSWKRHTAAENTIVESEYTAGLCWNEKFIFQAFTDSAGIPSVLRHFHDLSGYENCLYENEGRDPVIVEIEPDTVPKPLSPPPMPKNLEERSIEKQGAFITSDRSIEVFIRDYEDIDGDTVSIFYNNVPVLLHYGLTARSRVLKLEVEPGAVKDLIIYAINEGSRPPCTVSVILKDSKRQQRFTIQSNLSTNGSISIGSR